MAAVTCGKALKALRQFKNTQRKKKEREEQRKKAIYEMNAFLFYFIQLLIGIGVHSSVHDKRHYFGFLLVEYGIYISRVVRLARFMFPY